MKLIIIFLTSNITPCAGEIKSKTQEVAIKSIGDLALTYERSLTDDLSVVCLQDISQESQDLGISDTSISSIAKNGLQTTVAKIMVNVTKKTNTTEEVRIAAVEGICRLLLSGRSSVALLVSLVLFILQRDAEKKDCSKFKRVVHILMLHKTTHAILDETFKNTLTVLLMSDNADVEFEKAIEYFAKISNPEAISKVIKQQNNPTIAMSDDIYLLPLKLVCKALDLLQSYPEHHLAFTVCKTLDWFNIRPTIQKPFDSFHTEVGQLCKDQVYLCEELIEKCRNVIRERRTLKVLETFREMISESVHLLRVHEQHETEGLLKNKPDEVDSRVNPDDQNKKRSAPVSSQSDNDTLSDGSTIIANNLTSQED